MDYELKDIRGIRKKFNLTQFDLAKKAGVSQSLIAKIEAGRLDPTYSNAKKIFLALESLKKKDGSKAEDMMIKKIISVFPESSVLDIIKKMKKYEISQVLVIRSERLFGYISERDVLDAITCGKKNLVAKDLMKDSPPTIAKTASINIVSDLLKSYPIVVIVENGKNLGIITKADILKNIYKKRLF